MNDLITNLMNLPIELRSLAQFLVWRLERKPEKGKYSKEPYSVLTRYKCDAKLESNWTSFESAVEVYRLNPHFFSGVGFSIKQGGGIFCIDIDDCLDEQGVIKPEAQEILDDLPSSFVEISQSGHGLHYWGYGDLPKGHLCKYKLTSGVGGEIYSCKRFIAVTGNVYKGGGNLAC